MFWILYPFLALIHGFFGKLYEGDVNPRRKFL
jgi:hypothetical protein